MSRVFTTAKRQTFRMPAGRSLVLPSGRTIDVTGVTLDENNQVMYAELENGFSLQAGAYDWKTDDKPYVLRNPNGSALAEWSVDDARDWAGFTNSIQSLAAHAIESPRIELTDEQFDMLGKMLAAPAFNEQMRVAMETSPDQTALAVIERYQSRVARVPAAAMEAPSAPEPVAAPVAPVEPVMEPYSPPPAVAPPEPVAAPVAAPAAPAYAATEQDAYPAAPELAPVGAASSLDGDTLRALDALDSKVFDELDAIIPQHQPAERVHPAPSRPDAGQHSLPRPGEMYPEH